MSKSIIVCEGIAGVAGLLLMLVSAPEGNIAYTIVGAALYLGSKKYFTNFLTSLTVRV